MLRFFFGFFVIIVRVLFLVAHDTRVSHYRGKTNFAFSRVRRSDLDLFYTLRKKELGWFGEFFEEDFDAAGDGDGDEGAGDAEGVDADGDA